MYPCNLKIDFEKGKAIILTSVYYILELGNPWRF